MRQDRSSGLPRSAVQVRPAGEAHQVITLRAGDAIVARPASCGECPWRVENAGNFPAEAFVHSARTAQDMSLHLFACHTGDPEAPEVCAGFLLRGAQDNLGVRLERIKGNLQLPSECGAALWGSYREMAQANGADLEHPAFYRVRRENGDLPLQGEASGPGFIPRFPVGVGFGADRQPPQG